MRCLLRFALLPCGLAFAQTGPTGHWEGAIKLPEREIQLAADLAKDEKGAWIGTLAQSGQVIPLADIAVADKSVKFRLSVGGANAPAFDCILETAALNCTINTPGGSIASTLKRTGDAKVDLPKASPAVSAALEGNWEGAVETPSGSLRLVVHFKNLPDQTVKATLDSLDQGAADLPLTDVVQKESAVEFQLRLANGAYKGTLNKEATQITGDWTQGGGTMPLVLKKSTPK
jgi:hypothetical protein